VGIPATDGWERRDDARRVPAGRAARAAYRRRAGAGLIVGALAFPAAAAAQDPVPVPPPAKGTLSLKAQKVHRDGPRRIALTRDQWRVRGEVRPFVAGQTVEVRFFRRGRQIHAQTERLKPARGGRLGRFLVPFRSARAGRVVVRAVHRATPELERLRSKRVRVNVMRARVGSVGPLVRLLQRGLARMHYAVPRSGVYDDGTARAVMAWRKMTGAARTYTASEAVLRGVLDGRGRFRVRYPRDGRHVEADLSRQVLALIDGDEVRRIYHTSSGTSATPTVLGKYRVYRKSPGVNAKGMVHSTYFIRGYAIHGYASVPAYPASHGCLRVPIANAWSIYTWVRMGSVVRVYP
jgi:peptidoglycan hydrolase-like protein with peptidoglycan-binding domain